MIPYLPRDLPSAPVFPKRVGKFAISCNRGLTVHIWASAILGDELYCFVRWEGGEAIGKFTNEEGIGGRRLFDSHNFHIVRERAYHYYYSIDNSEDRREVLWRHFVHSTKRKPKKNRFRSHMASRITDQQPTHSMVVDRWVHGTMNGLLNYLDRLGMEIPCR